LSPKIKRHATVYNLFVTLILTSIIESLLLFAGKWRLDEPGPSYTLCLMQASLIFGCPAMVTSAAFALIYQMWWTLRNPSGTTPKDGAIRHAKQRKRTIVLLLLPYVLLLAIGIPSLLYGAHNPEAVNRQRRFFYCNIHKKKLTGAIGIVSGIILFATAFLEAWAALIIRRSWIALASAGQKRQGNALDKNSVLRVAIFGAYIVLSFLLSFDGLIGSRSVVPDMIRGITAIVIFLIFGTQLDVLRIWLSWITAPYYLVRGEKPARVPVEPHYPGLPLKSFNIDPEPSSISLSTPETRTPPSIYSSHNLQPVQSTPQTLSEIPSRPRAFDEESQLSTTTVAPASSLYRTIYSTEAAMAVQSPVPSRSATPNSRMWERDTPSRSTTVDETDPIVSPPNRSDPQQSSGWF
jgi:hypothetical protein